MNVKKKLCYIGYYSMITLEILGKALLLIGAIGAIGLMCWMGYILETSNSVAIGGVL